MKWTKIYGSLLASYARDVIFTNTFADYTDVDTIILSYHNLSHVANMYKYLHDTNEPYSEALDWAVLFHDIVYDNLPDKELRSANFFEESVEQYEGCTLDYTGRKLVSELIMSTKDHLVSKAFYSPIVRADLSGLSDSVSTFYNYDLVMQESMKLYDITERTFATHNYSFMVGLGERVRENLVLDKEHSDFYQRVLRGISQTRTISTYLQD